MPETVPVSEVIPPAKAKRVRKPRVVTPKAPRKPSLPLLARVKAMGVGYIDAYRLLAKTDPAFADGLRAEVEWRAAHAKRQERFLRAGREYEAAEAALRDEGPTHSEPYGERLNALAANIASATAPAADDEPESPAS